VKRFPGTLDLFNHLRVSISRRRRGAMGYLDQAKLLSPFLGLRRNSARYGLASYLLELMDRVAPEGGAGPDTRRLFAFALGALRSLENVEVDLRLRILYELRAMDALGLRPELAHCVRCGAPPGQPTGFYVPDGGVVCGACAGGLEGVLPLQLGTLRALQQGLEYDIDRLPRLMLSPDAVVEAERLVFRFQRFHVGLELKSEKFLTGLLRVPDDSPA